MRMNAWWGSCFITLTCIALLSTRAAQGANPAAQQAQVPGPLHLAAVSAGYDHTCGITSTGSTYCWGNNDSGQLGSGTSGGYQSKPVLVAGNLLFSSITAGFHHTCGITTTGATYCWGANGLGQLGIGTQDQQTHPLPQQVQGGYTFIQISAGGAYTCAVNREHFAWCWGQNRYGQLGNGSVDPTGTRTRPDLVGGGTIKFSSVSAGFVHTCGIAMPIHLGPHDLPGVHDLGLGRAYCWGRNLEGELGNNSAQLHATPVLISGGHEWASISARGWFHDNAGNLICSPFTCGTGLTYGLATSPVTQCGLPYEWGWAASGSSDIPQHVPGDSTFTTMDGGVGFGCGIAGSGSSGGPAYCWGNNNVGQLGSGSPSNSTTPAAVSGGLVFTSLSTGASHACGIAAGGVVYCWGWNSTGQLGDGSTQNRNIPVAVQ